jgi:hypothetical protein
MIYNKLGCGSVEKVYKNALIKELRIRKIIGFALSLRLSALICG